MKVKKTNCNFERESLIAPFGFKGSYVSEIWQSIVRMENDRDQSGIGLCSQGTLWSDSKIFAGSLENIESYCYSAFGNFYITPDKLKALARYDIYISGFNDALVPDGAQKLKMNSNLLIIGIDYMPDKHIHIIPNIQIQTFEDPDSKKENAIYVHLQYKL